MQLQGQAEIARYIIGLAPAFDDTRVAQWVFELQPNNITQTQTHTGFLMGDVTLNGSEPETNPNVPEVGAAQLQSAPIAVNVPSIRVTPNQTTTVSIDIDSIIGRNIGWYELSLSYDPAIMRVEGVSKVNGVASDWDLFSNLNEAGEVRIVSYGTGTILGENGQLLELSINVLGEPGTQTDLTISHLRLANGDYSVENIDGSLQIDYMTYMPIIK